jgi:hypothetical protein
MREIIEERNAEVICQPARYTFWRENMAARQMVVKCFYSRD